MNIVNDLIKQASTNLISQIEDAFIKGLEIKGFRFETREELETFIKDKCHCEIIHNSNTKTYFVNDEPFFIHYNPLPEITNNIPQEREYKISINLGSYEYPTIKTA